MTTNYYNGDDQVIRAGLFSAAGEIIVSGGDNVARRLEATSVGGLSVGSDPSSADGKGINWIYNDTGGISSLGRAQGTGAIKAATFDASRASSTLTLVDGTIYLSAIHIPYACTINGVGWVQTTAGDTTADNNNKIGLYTSDGSTTLTKVAECADDGGLWEDAAGYVGKDFTATYAATAGQTVFVAALANWSAVATSPAIAAAPALSHAVLMDLDLSSADLKLVATQAAQADLGDTEAWSDFTAGTAQPFFVLF